MNGKRQTHSEMTNRGHRRTVTDFSLPVKRELISYENVHLKVTFIATKPVYT